MLGRAHKNLKIGLIISHSTSGTVVGMGWDFILPLRFAANSRGLRYRMQISLKSLKLAVGLVFHFVALRLRRSQRKELPSALFLKAAQTSFY